MSNTMLIDAAHPEETRVVVLRGNRVEEFDFEAADRQQLKGNIYLAKVTRVEPSLQAAFVEYGGNRHGFLAFSEIHPDYYQIPVADRQALIEAEIAEDQDASDEIESANSSTSEAEAPTSGAEDAGTEAQDKVHDEGSIVDDATAENTAEAEQAKEATPDAAADKPSTDAAAIVEPAETGVDHDPEDSGADEPALPAKSIPAEASATETVSETAESDDDETKSVLDDKDDHVEDVGAEDALEELPAPRKTKPKHYKIQEVIKRRQVILVQVVKEERGNKGAALTTYLSLAGRYSVLMPNTARGGGISRKITDGADRKRLKSIASELQVPEGMGVILRTAGASRTRAEIRRDFDYLLRLWENVREQTLKSVAPRLVYEEGNLVKRSIRDLYSREIKEVNVAGDDAYREAKEFMRMLMPSHARNVKPYRDSTPIFARYGVEAQLDMMFSPRVTLKSGGYLIIDQTEALVAIDVNSGRATRQHNIEDTALHTNLEAAEEVARQLRLRDLAGLIVIDFIDMEENRNNRAVERKLKDCLKNERARIQVGRISHFGLLEMSRQRLRTGVLESSVQPCPTCNATGHVRSVSSLALQILRGLEDYLVKAATHHLTVRTRPDAALYVLNQKRAHLADLESRFALTISITAEAPDDGSDFLIERGEVITGERPQQSAMRLQDMAVSDVDDAAEAAADEEAARAEQENSEDEATQKRPRRRRRRRRGGNDNQEASADTENKVSTEPIADQEARAEEATKQKDAPESSGDDEEEQGKRRRRRGRRGGKRRGRNRDEETVAASDPSGDSVEPAADASKKSDETIGVNGAMNDPADPVRVNDPIEVPAGANENTLQEAPVEEEKADPDKDNASLASEGEQTPSEPDLPSGLASDAGNDPSEDEQTAPKRSGWWNRRSFF